MKFYLLTTVIWGALTLVFATFISCLHLRYAPVLELLLNLGICYVSYHITCEILTAWHWFKIKRLLKRVKRRNK